MKALWVNQLAPGQDITETFVIRKLDVREYNNRNYLTLEFGDKTGYINGVCWENADNYLQILSKGNIVRITGKVATYKGALQINVADMVKIPSTDFDPRDFLPQGPHDLRELMKEIDIVISSITDPHYQQLLGTFFNDKAFRKRFVFSPAAKLWHHSYVGGLAYHSLCIAKMASRLGEVYGDTFNRDLLITGALLHDMGKMETYSLENYFDYTDEGRLIGHVIISDQMVRDKIAGLPDFPPEKQKLIRHMIISHHGELRQAAPVVPQTIEANVLYMLDLLDCRIGGILVEKNRPRQAGQKWTEYVKLLERFLYFSDGV